MTVFVAILSSECAGLKIWQHKLCDVATFAGDGSVVKKPGMVGNVVTNEAWYKVVAVVIVLQYTQHKLHS